MNLENERKRLKAELEEINSKIARNNHEADRFKILKRNRDAKYKPIIDSIARGDKTIVKYNWNGEIMFKLINPKTGESFDTYNIETLNMMGIKESDFLMLKRINL